MRDLALREALATLAEEAAERLRELVAAGEELPYDVTEPGGGSPFAQFTPQTGPFIRGHGTLLLELGSFGPACSAIAASEVAKPYLEWLGEPIPNDPGRRAADAVLAFLCRLWEGSAEFSLDRPRLDEAIAELELSTEPAHDGEAEVIAPVLGLQMPVTRLELAGATLVRAEAVDAPAEVRASEGARRAAWNPLFLAVVRRPVAAPGPADGAVAGEAPGHALCELITALRLFKPGGVCLGPYAWARSFSGDRWRRIATGAPRARGNGYWLVESELGDMADFTRAIADRPGSLDAPDDGPGGSLARAVARFEAGLERGSLLEALSDYLLALRFVLDGGGPAGVGLAMRASALRAGADADARPAVKQAIERALALESVLIRGEHPVPPDAGSPLELVVRIESIVRGILRDAASGRLAPDLRAVADEVLLADGLAAGEGAATLRGTTAEWEAVSAEPRNWTEPEPEPELEPEPEPEADEEREPEPVPPARGRGRRAPPILQQLEPDLVTVPETDPPEGDSQPSDPDPPGRSPGSEAEEDGDMPDQTHSQPTVVAEDWLEELDSQDTMDWPQRPAALRMLDRRPSERKATRDRVQHLFPRPETTEWSVGELDYDRRRDRVKV